jgi:hypothetical protein
MSRKKAQKAQNAFYSVQGFTFVLFVPFCG